MKSAIPDFFADRDPKNNSIEKVCKRGQVWFFELLVDFIFNQINYRVTLVLPLESDKSPRFIINRLGECAQNLLLSDIMKVSLMMAEVLSLENDADIIMGHIVITDLKGMGMALISQYTPQMVK